MTILLTISGLQFHKNEGSKKRLDSFIDSYAKQGYEVSVLLFFNLRSLRYIFSKSQYLNNKATWFLFPTLPISFHKVITYIAVYINQIVLSVFSRLKKYDIIQAEIIGIVGKWASNRSLFITDFHGDSVSELEYNNGGKPNWFSKWMRIGQRKSIQYSDYIIVVSANLKKQLEKNTGEAIKAYSIISCGVDIQRFMAAEAKKEYLDTERIVLGYLGGFQKWQNISTVLTLTEQLRIFDERIYLKLFTNDDITPYQEKLNKIGKENFEIKALAFNEVPSYLKTLDAGFLIRDNLVLNIVSSPTKLAEYLAAGVPVICTKFSGDYERSINHGVEGFVLEHPGMSEDEGVIKELYSFLCAVKADRVKFRKTCMESAKEKKWDKEFAAFINELI